jgi:hypothetical protein
VLRALPDQPLALARLTATILFLQAHPLEDLRRNIIAQQALTTSGHWPKIAEAVACKGWVRLPV